ncbi:RNase adapter RapZ [Caldicellulosiruptoraceae bacterium PP1]
MKIVIISGMSGAGKSLAIRAFEDMGFFCIDNLPPQFLTKITELAFASMSNIKKIAAVVDIRGGELFSDLINVISEMTNNGIDYDIVFLDASDDVLIKRYKESRRKHPLMEENEGRIAEAIKQERELLKDIKQQATYIIDTSNLNPKDFKEKLIELFTNGKEIEETLYINVASFGFKYGLPLDSDLVFDVRFLPNPFYVETLKHKTGETDEVKEYVLKWDVTSQFINKLKDLIIFLIPNYIEEGKTQLVISIGCTGGKHRSVVIAKEIYNFIKENGYKVSIYHRDIAKD